MDWITDANNKHLRRSCLQDTLWYKTSNMVLLTFGCNQTMNVNFVVLHCNWMSTELMVVETAVYDWEIGFQPSNIWGHKVGFQDGFSYRRHLPHFPGFAAHMSRPHRLTLNKWTFLTFRQIRGFTILSKNSHGKCEELSVFKVSCRSLFLAGKKVQFATSRTHVVGFWLSLTASIPSVTWLVFSLRARSWLSKRCSSFSCCWPQSRTSADEIEVGQQQKRDSATLQMKVMKISRNDFYG